jgi:hypothetical protein
VRGTGGAVRRAGWVVGIVVLLSGLVGQASALPLEPAPGGSGALAREDWQVERVTGGYRVTLHLSAPLRLTDSLPLLAVDGKVAGPARESADRRTLTLVTADPAVARASDVRVVRSAAELTTARTRTAAQPGLAQTGRVLAEDPGSAGRYAVDTSEYDLGDEAVFLPGLGQRAEVRAKVYTPRNAPGKRPLVMFLHGRHSICYGPEPDPLPDRPWPCPRPMKPIPSYRGYDAPATALASHGYVVVSISANAINGWDHSSSDAGAQARGQLVLAHLDLWRTWSAPGGRYAGRVDLDRVGLMGHSRGGDGVVAAALLNNGRARPYGIRAVLPLAPTDFARPTLPGVAMSVILPYCDGDVSDLQGQHFYDDSRYALTDDAARSTVLVMGANHNYFNTEWTPGQSVAPSWDDWGGEPEAVCGDKHAGRLRATEQQAAGRAYIAGFFRLYLGRETRLLPFLDGSDARAASAGRAVVRVTAQAPRTARLDVSRLESALPAGSVRGHATAAVCAGGTNGCGGKEFTERLPNWTPAWFAARTPLMAATRVRWTGTDGAVRLPLRAGSYDVRSFSALTFRTAPDPAYQGNQDLTVRVIDGKGKVADVPVSAVSDALRPLPGGDGGLPKTMLRNVRIPLTRLAGIDLRDVRAVELRTNRSAAGGAIVSDLAFARGALGTPGPSDAPRLSVTDVKVAEGNSGQRSAVFEVRMSRPAPGPVTVYAEKSAELQLVTGDVVRKLVFAPGQTVHQVSVPITPNDRDGDDDHFQLVLSVPHDAVLVDNFGDGLVTDDDPTPTLSIGSAVAVEGPRKTVRFPVTLSHPSDKYVFVTVSLTSGTATLGKDFRSPWDDGEGAPENEADGGLDPRRTQGWIEVRVVDDKTKENTETFTARVKTVDAAIVTGRGTVIGAIRDDD